MRLAKSLPAVLWHGGLAVIVAAGPLVSEAFGAEAPPSGSATGLASETLFLLQIMVLILAGRLLGEAMQRFGQSAVMGQLVAGVLLGPSVLGLLWPDGQQALFPANPEQKGMIGAVAQLGVLLLLLLTGMETDLKLVRKVARAAVAVSISGILLPFACGFALGQFLPESLLPNPGQRLIGSLFLGTALSISSVKIVAMVVREMDFMRRNVGQVILASAVIDDTVGWIIIAIIFSLAQHGALDFAALVRTLAGTALFLALSFTVGRRIVFWLIRWVNDNSVGEAAVVALILLLMGGMALITHLIGVHTVLGAFVAGVLVGESPILTRQIDQQLRGLIMGLFMPVFFGVAGLSTDLTILREPALLALTGGLILIASLGKFGGAFLGGTLGGLSRSESLALGCGMNARGSTEVIVVTIGLSLGVLSPNLFTMIVAMAIITTTAMPPMLRWALSRVPLGKDEKARLEREEFEAKGFLPNLERLLLAVDESANGTFASRITGLIAGARGLPTTVLHVGPDAKQQEQDKAEATSPESTVKAGAKTTAAAEQGAEEPKPAKVDVTTRSKDAPTGEAVAKEARKGYGLLVIGVDKIAAPGGGFHPEITRIATGFDGPLALVVARGDHLEHPADSMFRMLVPVNGTAVSQRAAEVAVALARANDVAITALYVTAASKRDRGATSTRRHEEAILKDVVDLAERYDTEARTAVRVDVAADQAILREARAGRFNLIVIGVQRRPGESLFLGDTAAAIIEKAEASILFVSS